MGSSGVLSACVSGEISTARGCGTDGRGSTTKVVSPGRPRGERCRDISYLPDLAPGWAPVRGPADWGLRALFVTWPLLIRERRYRTSDPPSREVALSEAAEHLRATSGPRHPSTVDNPPLIDGQGAADARSGRRMPDRGPQGTTVTGHLPIRTRRTATEPTSRCPACVEAPTTTASTFTSSAIRTISVTGSPARTTYSMGTWYDSALALSSSPRSAATWSSSLSMFISAPTVSASPASAERAAT